MTVEPATSELVDRPDLLARAARGWQEAPALALDTEFVRERTFWARLGLVQVAAGGGAALVDPLALPDLAPLRARLEDPRQTKVLHSAGEDLEVLQRAVGALPRPLFDTQIAAGLAGVGTSLSYQKLVAALLGVELFKGETRTPWLARPLSPAQLAYAAEDVVYLLPLYDRLRERLAALGRLEWALADSAALLDPARFVESPETAYLRLRGAGRLTRRQLGVLQTLAAWRDREARRRDLPRGFVLRDELLLALAARQPRTLRDLHRLRSLDARQAARDGATWLELVRQAAERPEAELPPLPPRVPPSAAAKELAERLRQRVRRRADELGLPPEVLAPRRALDALLRSVWNDPEPRLPPELEGWRRGVVGDELLAEVGAARHG